MSGAGPASAAAQRVVFRTAVVFIIGWTVLLAGLLLAWPTSLDPAIDWSLLACLSVIVFTVLWARGRISGTSLFALITVASCSVLVLDAFVGAELPPLLPHLGWGALVGITTALVLDRRIWRRTLVIVSLGLLVLIAAVGVLASSFDLRITVLAPSTALIYGMIAGSIVDTVLAAGERDDAAASLAEAAAADATAASAAADESFRLSRMLHDGVVNTFGAIRWSGAETRLLRERCARDVRDIETHWAPNTADVESANLSDLVARAELAARLNSISLQVVHLGPVWNIPSTVLHAMSGALDEALQNASKHGGTTLAVLTVDFSSSIVRIALDDDGDGFNASPKADDQGGVARSIHERCERVGVSSEFQESELGGTRLTLEWRSPERKSELALNSEFALRSALTVLAMEVGLWLLLRLALDVPFDWSSAAVWWWFLIFALVGVGLVVGITSARRRFPLGLIPSAALVVMIAVISVVPPGGESDCVVPGLGIWQPLAAVTVILALMWLSTGFLWTGIALSTFVIGWAAQLVLVSADSGCSTPQVIFLIIYPLGVFALWLVRRFVERFGRDAQVSINSVRTSREATVEAISRREVRERIWRASVSGAVDLLRQISSGSRDPDSDEVREEAAIKESLLRNCIQLDGAHDPISSILLDVCETAAMRGVMVTVNYSPTPPPDASSLHGIEQVLRDLMSRATPPSATITSMPIGHGGAIVCSTAQEELAPEYEIEEATVRIDASSHDPATVAEISWNSSAAEGGTRA